MNKAKKILKSVSVIGLLMVSNPAAADGWYGKFSLGYLSPKSLNVTDSFAAAPAPQPVSLNYDSGLTGTVGIGYQINMLRLEGEFALDSLDYDSIDAVGGVTEMKGKSNSFMANGYLDFDMDAVLMPYVGMGIGYSKSTLGAVKDDYLSMQGMIGFNYAFFNEAIIGLEYRYKTSVSGAMYDTRASHAAMLTFRVNF